MTGERDNSEQQARAVVRVANSDASAAILMKDDGASFVQLITGSGKCSWECAQGVVLLASDLYIACAVWGVGDVAFSTTRAAVKSGEAVSLWLSGPWRDPAQVTVGRFDGRELVVDFVPVGGKTTAELPGLPQSWMPDRSEIRVSIPDRDLAARVAALIAS